MKSSWSNMVTTAPSVTTTPSVPAVVAISFGLRPGRKLETLFRRPKVRGVRLSSAQAER
ncbi:unnamed protein product [Arabis nemorensis]|uniref:Uncharacterized protein n=1 Tax=Arabis nemorensis TaxID=586526 RepID=A0A565AQ67_9BRAS|nr:unnamed protein product [Arabis nemorensis]